MPSGKFFEQSDVAGRRLVGLSSRKLIAPPPKKEIKSFSREEVKDKGTKSHLGIGSQNHHFRRKHQFRLPVGADMSAGPKSPVRRSRKRTYTAVE
eukprot:scaffold135817_cov18-Prasinocladus_malaysianus.AAC.2